MITTEDLIKRNLAISYATSGLIRRIDGEDWIRISEVKQSLNDVPSVEPPFKPYCEVKFDKEQLTELVEKAKQEVMTNITIDCSIPKGEWTVDEDDDFFNYRKCSNCGKGAEWLDGGSQFISNFCPNCGAEMKRKPRDC